MEPGGIRRGSLWQLFAQAKACKINGKGHYLINMKTLLSVLGIAVALQFASLSANSAETAKTYQVTGPILEITEKVITVQKGDERWEIARNDNTKVEGELKVGKQVTIHYRMVGVTVDARAEGKKKAK